MCRSSSRAINNTETGNRQNATGKTEQGFEGKVGRTGDCSEDKDQGHYCCAGEQNQQFGRATGC